EMPPIEYTMMSRTSPNANAVATTPADAEEPVTSKPKQSVAVPTAANTKNAVPSASAASLRANSMDNPFRADHPVRRRADRAPCRYFDGIDRYRPDETRGSARRARPV